MSLLFYSFFWFFLQLNMPVWQLLFRVTVSGFRYRVFWGDLLYVTDSDINKSGKIIMKSSVSSSDTEMDGVDLPRCEWLWEVCSDPENHPSWNFLCKWWGCIKRAPISAKFREGWWQKMKTKWACIVLMRCILFLAPMQTYFPNPNASCEAWRKNGYNWERNRQSTEVPSLASWLLEMGKGRMMLLLFVYLPVSTVCRKRANLLPGETLRRPVWRGLAADTCPARWVSRWGGRQPITQSRQQRAPRGEFTHTQVLDPSTSCSHAPWGHPSCRRDCLPGGQGADLPTGTAPTSDRRWLGAPEVCFWLSLPLQWGWAPGLLTGSSFPFLVPPPSRVTLRKDGAHLLWRWPRGCEDPPPWALGALRGHVSILSGRPARTHSPPWKQFPRG